MTHGEGSAAAIRSPGTAAAFRRFPWWTAPSGASNRRQRCPASAPLGPSRRRLGRLRRRAGRSRAGSEIAEGGSEPLGNTPPLFPKNTSPKGVCSSSPNPGGDPKGRPSCFCPTPAAAVSSPRGPNRQPHPRQPSGAAGLAERSLPSAHGGHSGLTHGDLCALFLSSPLWKGGFPPRHLAVGPGGWVWFALICV